MAIDLLAGEREISRAGAVASSFARTASGAAFLAAATGFGYAVAFIIRRDARWSALFLLLGGLLATPVFVALYERLRHADGPRSLLALTLGLVGALGATIHGGYDLASALNPSIASPDLPNPVDPRGLLTFGLAGLALLIVARLMAHDGGFPRGLVPLTYLLALLLVTLYLGRLIILDATNPAIVIPALVSGFVVNPAWYLWIGLTLRRGHRT